VCCGSSTVNAISFESGIDPWSCRHLQLVRDAFTCVQLVNVAGQATLAQQYSTGGYGGRTFTP
jgi:hypothetical protein